MQKVIPVQLNVVDFKNNGRLKGEIDDHDTIVVRTSYKNEKGQDVHEDRTMKVADLDRAGNKDLFDQARQMAWDKYKIVTDFNHGAARFHGWAPKAAVMTDKLPDTIPTYDVDQLPASYDFEIRSDETVVLEMTIRSDEETTNVGVIAIRSDETDSAQANADQSISARLSRLWNRLFQ